MVITAAVSEIYRYMFKRTGVPKLGGMIVGAENTASQIVRALPGGVDEHRSLLHRHRYLGRSWCRACARKGRRSRRGDLGRSECRALASHHDYFLLLVGKCIGISADPIVVLAAGPPATLGPFIHGPPRRSIGYLARPTVVLKWGLYALDT